MPTERHGKVRRMLRDGLAHVVRLVPFTIQLDYSSCMEVQEVSLGIDAGSKHIGVSATTEKREVFAMQVEERDDIVKLIADRREARRTRRNRKTRYRAARFDNRRRKRGWMPPSIENKIQTHERIIRFIYAILPISKTIIEVAQFDLQKIKNPDISGVEYQQGEQLGSHNVREYVLARDKHTCQHCKGKSNDPILNVHHIETRKTGGNAPNDLITLCKTCHDAYHDHEIDLDFKRGISLRDAAFMNRLQSVFRPRKRVFDLVNEEFPNVHVTYGYITKHRRITNNIEKTHCADAFCITGNVGARRLAWFWGVRMQRRHNRRLHLYKPAKGGIRRSNIASHWIGKSRLQQYDYVEWNGQKAFISGSQNGRPYLKNFEDKYIMTPKASVNAKTVKFIRRKRGSMVIEQLPKSMS